MRRVSAFLFSIVCLSLSSIASADITMTVVASPAPNVFGSPSWSGYTTNALNSLENSLGEIGDRSTDPTAYEIFSDGQFIDASEIIVSNFSSWRGVADEAAPFDGEFGNRVHFGLHIVGDGTMRFRLEDLSYFITSDDGDVLGFSGSFAGLTYSSTRIGIDYGVDQAKGGGDDIIITSGAATQIVDELIYTGVGNAYDATDFPGPSGQEKLDQTIDFINSAGFVEVTGGYILTDEAGETVLADESTSFTIVPEPGTGLLVVVMAGAYAIRRRRQT